MDSQKPSVDMFSNAVAFSEQRQIGFNLMIARSPLLFNADQELLTNRVMHYLPFTFSIIFHLATPHHQERGQGNTRRGLCLPTVLSVYPQCLYFYAYGRCFPYSANIPHHSAHVNYLFIYNACPVLCVKSSRSRWTSRRHLLRTCKIYSIIASFIKHL